MIRIHSAEKEGAIRRLMVRSGTGLLGIVVAAGQALGQESGSRFKTAPGVGKAEPSEDMILGLVHTNTLFFIAVAVIGVFWFTFGGGRKPKLGSKKH